MSGFVYLWKNLKNGKSYVGSHKGDVTDNYIGSGVYFRRAYDKNPNDFARFILYEGDNFRDFESDYLKSVDAASSDMFYNLKNESIGGWNHVHSNEKLKQKKNKAISKAKKGKSYNFMLYDKFGKNNPMYGKKHSKETKDKISKKRKGQTNHSKKVLEEVSGRVFKSVVDCAKFFKVTPSTMTVLIRGEVIKRGKCKNKIFQYV